MRHKSASMFTIAATALLALALTCGSGGAGPLEPVSSGTVNLDPMAAAPDVKQVRRHAELPIMPQGTWTSSDWDGQQFATDQPDWTSSETGSIARTTLPVIHPVYLFAKDSQSRFADYAAMFQVQQERASALLTGATGMAFRWDERLGTDGGLYHDITVLKAKKASFAQLSGNQQFKYVRSELSAAGLNLASKKYVVWLDAPPGPSPTLCGESTTSVGTSRSFSNPANGTSTAVFYRTYPTDTVNVNQQRTGGFCSPILHELTHSMGAVLSVAPHYGGGGHCGDDPQDQMCSRAYTGQSYDPSQPIKYDSGNDDYLDPAADLDPAAGAGKLPWWTVNLSKFLCPRGADPGRPNCAAPNNPRY